MDANLTLASLRHRLKRVPWAGRTLTQIYRRLVRRPDFAGSAAHWEQTYANSGTSGPGSYGILAQYKATILNDFVRRNSIQSVIEFGCGDGNQLSLAAYSEYRGYDVSKTAVELCRRRFADDTTKSFDVVPNYAGETAELTLSLDVVFHLVEDGVFEAYMQRLFDAATRFVVIYSSDRDDSKDRTSMQVKHRKFTRWTDKREGWKLVEHLENPFPFKGDPLTGSFSSFFIFGRVEH